MPEIRRVRSYRNSFYCSHHFSKAVINSSFPKENILLIKVNSSTPAGKILYRKYVKNETNKDYLDGLQYIAERGTIIKAVICDGHMGLL